MIILTDRTLYMTRDIQASDACISHPSTREAFEITIILKGYVMRNSHTLLGKMNEIKGLQLPLDAWIIHLRSWISHVLSV